MPRAARRVQHSILILCGVAAVAMGGSEDAWEFDRPWFITQEVFETVPLTDLPISAPEWERLGSIPANSECMPHRLNQHYYPSVMASPSLVDAFLEREVVVLGDVTQTEPALLLGHNMPVTVVHFRVAEVLRAIADVAIGDTFLMLQEYGSVRIAGRTYCLAKHPTYQYPDAGDKIIAAFDLARLSPHPVLWPPPDGYVLGPLLRVSADAVQPLPFDRQQPLKLADLRSALGRATRP